MGKPLPTDLERLADTLQQASVQMVIAGGEGEKFLRWRLQAEEGVVTDPYFRLWLERQADYYGEKDRPYATYLRGLIASGRASHGGS